ncbi:hypothetical protein [Anaerovorax sp. IOR16]|uniref:hypothetical protein n=1 Tax=Anaerovorax sp. IOR16 TaxID=2773458 RepID=UPI0019D08A3F|nr:hypothetical protein [Anaerovorax sp. IOR16]
MICDDCTKKDVCRLKEQCNILERDIQHSEIEDSIILQVKCKHREVAMQGISKRPPHTLFGKPMCESTINEPIGWGKEKE